MSVAARRPEDGNLERAAPTVVVATMRRRHLRGVLQIEQQVYPRPWTFGLFLSELGQRSTRLYLVARVGHRVVGYLGMLRSLETATSPPSPSTRPGTARASPPG
jgi:hypothetical protein